MTVRRASTFPHDLHMISTSSPDRQSSFNQRGPAILRQNLGSMVADVCADNSTWVQYKPPAERRADRDARIPR